MASIANDPNGRRRIQFVAPDGSRRTIRLGKVDRKSAESVCRHVEVLLAAKITSQPLPRDTASWLASVSDDLRDKLANVGLIAPQQRLTVARYLGDWYSSKEAAGFKPTSLRAWGQTVRALIEVFGPRLLTDLTHSDGEVFRGVMQSRGLRPTTIHKRLGHAKQMLEDAVRLGHLPANPWKHVRQRSGDPAERRAYVPIADIQRVIDHCPNVWWRLLVALARFAGLRVPSEAFSLTWGDVDWERGRLVVPSPKTEHFGKTHRVIPLFPMLRPYLEAAFDQASEGSVYIFPDEWRTRVTDDEWGSASLRMTFARIVRKAGVDPWPRIWHSLRASCESDLAQSFPLATVTRWLGNTPTVALRHYVDPTEIAYDQALNWTPPGGAPSGAPTAQNPAQQIPADNGIASQPSSKVLKGYESVRNDAGCNLSTHGQQREVIGIEHSSDSKGNTAILAGSVSPSGALDPDLVKVVNAWSYLPESIREAILVLVGVGR